MCCGCQRSLSPDAALARVPINPASAVQPPSKPAAAAALPQVVSDLRTVDLGKVIEGNDLRHTFTIRNTTPAPIKVLTVKKSCGCETANVQEGTVVSPGEFLEATYALSKYGAGEKRGHLAITTDAPDDSLRQIDLHLRGEIQPKLWATPSELQLSVVEAATSAQTLRVESIVPGLLETFQDVTTNRGNVVVTLLEQTSQALTFSVAPAQGAPWGTSYDLIYLAFMSREHPSLNVRVRTRKGHPLAIIPANLRLSSAAAGEAQKRKVRILSPAASSGGFRITSVELPENIFVGELPTEARRSCDVNLTIHRPESTIREQAIVFQTDPPGAVTLTVRYSHSAMP